MNRQAAIDTTREPRRAAGDPADMAARVIWKIVARDGGCGKRALFLLDGLPGAVLVAVSRSASAGAAPEPHRLALDPAIEGLSGATVESAHLYRESPVRIRNEDFPGPVLIAARESERGRARASLGTVPVLEPATILAETTLWIEAIFDEGVHSRTKEREAWLRAMIAGLVRSAVASDVLQFASILSAVAVGRGKPLRSSFMDAVPHLRLPRGCLRKVPPDDAARPTPAAFAQALADASLEAGNAPMLFDRDGRRFDIPKVREAVEDARARSKADARGLTPVMLDAVEALLDDASEINEAEWRPSQRAFCEDFDWSFADVVFTSLRKPRAPKLPERVKQLFTAEGQDDELRNLSGEFETLDGGGAEDARAAAAAILDARGEWIADKDAPLANKLRAFAHPSVIEHRSDLSAGLLRAYRLLLANASDDIAEAEAECGRGNVILTAPGAGASSTWRSLDRAIYEAFLLEMAFAEPVLDGIVEVDLGKWKDAGARPRGRSAAKAARVVNLQMQWRRAIGETPGHVVRLDWLPPADGIALALPADLDALYASFNEESRLRLWPATMISTTGAGTDAISLHDLGSFTLAGGANGRTGGDAGATVAPASDRPEFFEALRAAMIDEAVSGAIDPEEITAATRALDAFRTAMSEVVAMLRPGSPGPVDLDVVDRAATSFGALCAAAMPYARTERSRRAVVGPITEFGLVTSRDGEAAILPAWLPIRLFERRAKLARVRELIGEIADAHGAGAGFEREADDLAAIVDEHRLPEALIVEGRSFQVVDGLAGYGLAVAEAHDASARTALEASAEMAARVFLGVVDDYLALNPHEEANLSVAIYGAESAGLPQILTKGLEARMASNRDLRCELFITHDRASEIRDIFAMQNAALRERGTGGDGGFLSRLRVGVLPPKGRAGATGSAAVDVVLLHDAYLRNARLAWDVVDGEAASMPDGIDLHDWIEPRVPEFEAGGEKRLLMSLCVRHPPMAVARYLDLCYLSLESRAQLPAGKRAVPIRRATWRGGETPIGCIVERAHDLGEWVVSVDRMSTRAMLTDLGIEVIRDIPARHSDHRILVSSRAPSEALRRRIEARFRTFHGLPILDDVASAADDAIRTVVRVAGQKLLGASRSVNSANEIIGLAAAVRLIEGSLGRTHAGATPIWLSLDENRSAFGTGGKVADAVALVVDLDADRPRIQAFVLEAKCVETTALSEHAKGSKAQTVGSMTALRNRLAQDGDPTLKRATCRDLLHLIASKPEFGPAVGGRAGRDRLAAALLRGAVDFEIRGLSVVAVHDATAEMLSPRDHDFTEEAAAPARQLILSQREVSDLLLSGAAPFDLSGLLTRAMTGPEPPDAVPPEPSTGVEFATTGDAEVGDPSNPPVGGASQTDEPPEPEPTPMAHVDVPPDATAPVPPSAFPPPVARFLAEASRRPQAREGQEAIEAEARATADALQDALTQHGMEAVFHAKPYTITPNGTLVRFKGHRSLTERTIKAKLSELQTTHGIDVAYVRPGLGWIGIFVAAATRRLIHLANLWTEADWRETAPDANTSILLGRREDDGRPLWLNLADGHDGQTQHAPHTLIAGETGSGKGNLLQSILLQLAATNDPRSLRIKLIDPKQGADFFWMEETPHLDGRIIVSPDGSVEAFEALVVEMDRRYDRIVGARTRDIDGYNRKVAAGERLPRIVVAHDEMASWMQGSETYRASVEAALTNLASKARAAGIHIILVTQRASQEAIPPSVRENLGNKLCLKVSSDKGSVLALGMPGAEALLGRGHLAASLPGDAPSGSPFFIAQVPFISDDDLTTLGRLIGESWREA